MASLIIHNAIKYKFSRMMYIIMHRAVCSREWHGTARRPHTRLAIYMNFTVAVPFNRAKSVVICSFSARIYMAYSAALVW